MPVYRVRNWDAHFENNKSRTIDQCSYIPMPNKQHGMGFIRIISEPDGAAVFGIWALILQACSRQRRPRQGWLTDDGTAGGRAWTAGDMALRWRRSEGEVERALQVLTLAEVDWLESLDGERLAEAQAKPAHEVPAKCPPGAASRVARADRTERNGTEGKGTEGEGGAHARTREEARPETPPPPPPSAPTPKPHGDEMALPCDEEYIRGLQAEPAYRMHDVRNVFEKMVAKCTRTGKQPNRGRLIAWLNREPPAVNGVRAGPAPTKTERSMGAVNQRLSELEEKRRAGPAG